MVGEEVEEFPDGVMEPLTVVSGLTGVDNGNVVLGYGVRTPDPCELLAPVLIPVLYRIVEDTVESTTS